MLLLSTRFSSKVQPSKREERSQVRLDEAHRLVEPKARQGRTFLGRMYILKTIWSRWKTIARRIGIFQSKVILTIFYFIFLLPIGAVFSLFKDGLNIKSEKKSTWQIKEKQCGTLKDLREQF